MPQIRAGNGHDPKSFTFESATRPRGMNTLAFQYNGAAVAAMQSERSCRAIEVDALAVEGRLECAAEYQLPSLSSMTL
jgi:hypothetical protein